MLVFDTIEPNMVLAYSKMGQVIALNREKIDFFLFNPFGRSMCFQNAKQAFVLL